LFVLPAGRVLLPLDPTSASAAIFRGRCAPRVPQLGLVSAGDPTTTGHFPRGYHT